MSEFYHEIKAYIEDDDASSRIAADLAACIQKFYDAKDIDDIGKIDHNFVLEKGKVEGDDANTNFVFDLPRNSEAYAFLKAMYAEEVEEDDDEKIIEFVKEVCVRLTDEHAPVIRNTIRSKVIGDTPEEVVPIKRLEVMAVELVDYSAVDEDDKYVMKFHKMPGVPVNMQALMAFIMNAKENDDRKTTAQVIDEERLKGNKLFEGMLGVDRADKYLWDVNIVLYADYSFSDEFMESQKVTADGPAGGPNPLDAMG